jgi:hypothetical protein
MDDLAAAEKMRLGEAADGTEKMGLERRQMCYDGVEPMMARSYLYRAGCTTKLARLCLGIVHKH